MKTSIHFVALGLCALLAACGDNPDKTQPAPTPITEVPASATASLRAYANFTASLVPTDTQEPLDVNKVTPPVSETEEPQAI